MYRFRLISTLLLAVVLVFLQHVAYGQSWAWAKRIGGIQNDESQSIAHDAFGNVIIAGSFKSRLTYVGSFTLVNKTNTGTYDVMVVKYGATGNVIWAKSLGGSGSDYGKSVSVDATGNVYVTGYFKSDTLVGTTDTLFNASSNNSELFVAKYNSSGTLQWVRKVGASGNEIGYGICTALNGQSYITGYFSSDTLTINGDTLFKNGFGIADLLLFKMDTYGNIVWHSSYGGTGKDIGKAVRLGSSNELYVAGYFDSDTIRIGGAPYLNPFAGTEDILLFKTDTNGVVSWCRTLGDTINERPTDLAIDPAGNVYMSGFFSSSSLSVGATTLVNTASNFTSDAFIIKFYSSTGQSAWCRSLGGMMNDEASSVATDTGAAIYLVGRFDSNQLPVGTVTLNNHSAAGTSDLFVAEMDTAGNYLWAISEGRTDDDYCESVCAFNNKVFITGFYRDTTLYFGTQFSLPNSAPGLKEAFTAAIIPPVNRSPLPVALLSFSGRRTYQENVLLEWSTASEINNEHFDLERSDDGFEFHTIGVIDGNGTCNTIHDYTYGDLLPVESSAYYRLRQVDFDGVQLVTDPIIVKGLASNRIDLACNPVCGNSIELIVRATHPEQLDISLSDLTGKRVREDLHISDTSGNFFIDCSELSSGMYLLQVRSDNSATNFRVVIP